MEKTSASSSSPLTASSSSLTSDDNYGYYNVSKSMDLYSYNYMKNVENYVKDMEREIHHMEREINFLEDNFNILTVKFENTIEEALKQIGMADYKDRIQKEFKETVKEQLDSAAKEFKETVKEQLNSATSIIEKTFKDLNERGNSLNLSFDLLDKEIAKRQLVLDKIDFLAKELGYQMDIAQKSF